MLWHKFLFLLGIISFCSSYKILFITQIAAGSHYILASKLCKELARRGHSVTFVTPFAAKSPVENVTEIYIDGSEQVYAAARLKSTASVTSSPFEKSKDRINVHFHYTEHTISHPKIQKLLQSEEKFDAVILYQYFNEALFGIAHSFKAPLILFKSMPLYVSESFVLSHPNPSSYVPNILMEYTGRMDFWQRLRTTFYDFCMVLYYQVVMVPKHRELVRKYLPGSPDLYDFINNASLVLINSHVSTNEAVPLVPNAVEVGGFHIEEPAPLPGDLQEYLDGSKHGVVYFSMGSIFKSTSFTQEKKEAFFNTFANMKENILWKFEDENLAGLPENVKIMKWVPQSDVLAHPNVKAFITHGGLLSTMESVHRGVPLIGIPYGVDQFMNVAHATQNGYGTHVPLEELTVEKLSAAVNEILTDPSYKENVERRSKILRDRPIPPMESVLYWVEYVIRHEGAPHLRYPGADLSWFQRNLLDVAFCVFIPVLTIFAVKKFLSY